MRLRISFPRGRGIQLSFWRRLAHWPLSLRTTTDRNAYISSGLTTGSGRSGCTLQENSRQENTLRSAFIRRPCMYLPLFRIEFLPSECWQAPTMRRRLTGHRFTSIAQVTMPSYDESQTLIERPALCGSTESLKNKNAVQ